MLVQVLLWSRVAHAEAGVSAHKAHQSDSVPQVGFVAAEVEEVAFLASGSGVGRPGPRGTSRSSSCALLKDVEGYEV